MGIVRNIEFCFICRREGNDVHTNAAVSISQAILGGTIRIQGLYEDHTVQIIPGTSSGTKIRLTGKGMKKVNGYGSGDHYVTLIIKAPKQLNDKQKALIQAYAELEDDTPGQILGVAMKKDGKCKVISFSPDSKYPLYPFQKHLPHRNNAIIQVIEG